MTTRSDSLVVEISASDSTAELAPDVQTFAHERFVDTFLSQNQRAQIGLFLAATLVASVWFETTRSLAAIAWLTVAAAIAWIRFRYTDSWVRQALPAARTQRIITVLWINGVLMAMPLAVLPQMSELERSAVSIVLLATATASVATTSGFRSVFIAYAAPMLLPLALVWGWLGYAAGSGASWGMAALVVFFLAFLVSVGKQSSAVFMEACHFRLGQQQLNQELKQALDEAGEANRAKTQFLAAASHDLRQPIHSINVLVAALSLRQLEAPAREIVVLLGTVNQTLSKQLDTLLDISKLDAGVVRAERAVHRLGSVVRAYHATNLPIAQELGLALELVCDDDVAVNSDASLLSRALWNIVDNALKYTPRGGHVRLIVRREGPDAVLQVIDDGIGIAPEEHDRVFREFYQVGNIERDRQKGLGLGLSIVRRLCALLGAKLALDSRLGVGTTITLRLPCVAVKRDAFDTGASRASSLGLNVLVVDDEALVRESMRHLLIGLNCRVHLADGPAAAEALARDHAIDIVLADFRLRDGESGLDAIRRVRALRPSAVAALITGDTAPDRIRDAENAGVPLLFKPVTLDKLIDVMPAAPP